MTLEMFADVFLVIGVMLASMVFDRWWYGQHKVLQAILKQQGELMATFDEVKAELGVIKDGVAAAAKAIQAQADTIASLSAQIAAGTPVSQEQLDSLKADEDAIVASLPAV